MTTFVHCRGCGTQIHETAPTCPKCGAPQFVAAPAPALSAVPAMAPIAHSPAPAATTLAVAPGRYADVPWYRRRWVLLLIALVFPPAAALIAWTGEVHYFSHGTVKTFPKSLRIVLTVLAVLILLFLAIDEEQLWTLANFCLLGSVIGWSLKK
jgi:hypothetical protein